MRGRDHMGSVISVALTNRVPLGPPHPCNDPVRAAEKGRSNNWVHKRAKDTGCGLRRFTWQEGLPLPPADGRARRPGQ